MKTVTDTEKKSQAEGAQETMATGLQCLGLDLVTQTYLLKS